MKRIALAIAALAIIAAISACGAGGPATNAQAWAAGYKYGDTTSSLDGFMAMLGDGASLTANSLKVYCEVAEFTKGAMPRKWMGLGNVSVKLAGEWQSGCVDGIGAEAKASTP
jgi:hypothetical protein